MWTNETELGSIMKSLFSVSPGSLACFDTSLLLQDRMTKGLIFVREDSEEKNHGSDFCAA